MCDRINHWIRKNTAGRWLGFCALLLVALSLAFIPHGLMVIDAQAAETSFDDFYVDSIAAVAEVYNGTTTLTWDGTGSYPWANEVLMTTNSGSVYNVYMAASLSKSMLTEEQLTAINSADTVYMKVEIVNGVRSYDGKFGVCGYGSSGMSESAYNASLNYIRILHGGSASSDTNEAVYDSSGADMTGIKALEPTFSNSSVYIEAPDEYYYTSAFKTYGFENIGISFQMSSTPSTAVQPIAMFDTLRVWFSTDSTFELPEEESTEDSSGSGDSGSGDSGSGGTTTIVLPSNAVELYPYSEITYADGGEAVLGNFSLKAGEKYLVIYDGEQYELEAISINELESGAVGLGGVAQDMTGEEVTCPFSLVYLLSQDVTLVVADSTLDGTTHNIAVYHLYVDYGDLLYDGLLDMVAEVDPENMPGFYVGDAYPLLQAVDCTVDGQVFTVEYNGQMYVCEAVLGAELFDMDSLVLGNMSLLDSSFTDTGEPFVLLLMDDGGVFFQFGAYDSDLVNKEIKLYFGDQTSSGGSGDSGSGGGSDSSSGGSVDTGKMESQLDDLNNKVDSIVTPDASDQEASDKIQQDAADKKEQSDKIREEIKEGDKVVLDVDNIQIDPFEQLDLNLYEKISAGIRSVFETPLLLQVLMIAVSFGVISYIFYGKR